MSNIYKYIYIVWSFRPPISPIVKSTKMSIFLQGVHTIYMKFNQGLREHLGAESFTTSLKVDLSRHKWWVLHLAGALMVHVFAPTPVVNYWHRLAKMKKSPIKSYNHSKVPLKNLQFHVWKCQNSNCVPVYIC